MNKNEMMKALEQYKMESGFYSVERILIDNGWNQIDARFAAILKSNEDQSREEAISKWPELAQLAEAENQKLHNIAKQNEPEMEAVNLIMVDDETGEEYTVVSQRPKQSVVYLFIDYDSTWRLFTQEQRDEELWRMDNGDIERSSLREALNAPLTPESAEEQLRNHLVSRAEAEARTAVFRMTDPTWLKLERGSLPTELYNVMTAAEVAYSAGLSESAVRKAIERKQIAARKSGGTWLIRRVDGETVWNKNWNDERKAAREAKYRNQSKLVHHECGAEYYEVYWTAKPGFVSRSYHSPENLHNANPRTDENVCYQCGKHLDYFDFAEHPRRFK